jgi:hypothetical protein
MGTSRPTWNIINLPEILVQRRDNSDFQETVCTRILYSDLYKICHGIFHFCLHFLDTLPYLRVYKPHLDF